MLEAKYEDKLGFPGGRECKTKKNSVGWGGGMDIFWNYTFLEKIFSLL